MSNPAEKLAANSRVLLNELLTNIVSSRAQAMRQLLDPRRDINQECGYQEDLDVQDYARMISREGIASRVNSVWPDETWVQEPIIEENNESEQTEFEEAWVALENQHNLYHYMHRADVQSGIGRFGILLLGFADGKDLKEPVPGVVPSGPNAGSKSGDENVTNELIYVRVFDETCVDVAKVEKDQSSPRYGQPVLYNVDFNVAAEGDVSLKMTRSVHWTRVIHLADNRTNSEFFGVPRLEKVWNRLMDLRKLLGGSAEMFWKGAFPGYAFESDPDVALDPDDIAAMREEFGEFANSLNRFVALVGGKAKQFSPAVADPSAHIEWQIKCIAMTILVPWRVLVGSEQAQLASEQDRDNLNKRITVRRNRYVSPCVIRPLIDRLIVCRVLPEPVGTDTNAISTSTQLVRFPYNVLWPDIAESNPKDDADVAEVIIRVIANYISSGAATIIPEMVLLTDILGFDPQKAETILAEAEARILDMTDENEDANVQSDERDDADDPDDDSDDERDGE